MELIGVIVALAGAVCAGIVSVATYLTTRKKSDKDIVAQERSISAQERIDEFTIMDRTIAVLRENLEAAQADTEKLQADVASARTEISKLNGELTAALANVAILSLFIEEQVPAGIARPKLRSVV